MEIPTIDVQINKSCVQLRRTAIIAGEPNDSAVYGRGLYRDVITMYNTASRRVG